MVHLFLHTRGFGKSAQLENSPEDAPGLSLRLLHKRGHASLSSGAARTTNMHGHYSFHILRTPIPVPH